MRLLFTARDAGAALQNSALIESFRCRHFEFEALILTQAPAAQIFEASGEKFIDIEESTDGIPELIDTWIREFDPHFAMLGLSGTRLGVDEFARKSCLEQGIPCGVIQDYWGYLGQFAGASLPDIFFVFDDYARSLTLRNAEVKVDCIVTGSPKHELFRHRMSGWSGSIIADGSRKKTISFIAQPLSLPGVHANFMALLDTFRACLDEATLLVRPHPSNPADAGVLGRDLARSGLKSCEIVASTSIEALMFQSDVVTTCFSTCGYDHNHMQLHSVDFIGHLVYLNLGDDIMATIRAAGCPDGIPPVARDLAHVCRSERQLEDVLRKALAGTLPSFQTEIARRLSAHRGAAEKVLSVLMAFHSS